MNKKLLIFGIGEFSSLVRIYFDTDSDYEVVAFVLDDAYIGSQTAYEGLNVYNFSTIELIFPPSEYDMFISIGYSKMSQNREKKFYEAKAKGYKLATFVSSYTTYLSNNQPGENCFIFENNTVQPFAKIGNNVFIWSCGLVAHHCIVEDHTFIAAMVLIGGYTTIKKNCFLGNRSTINPSLVIAEKTMIGSGTIITKNTDIGSVHIAPRSLKMHVKSDKITL